MATDPDGAAPLPGRRVWVDAQLQPALARWLAAEYGVDAAHVAQIVWLTYGNVRNAALRAAVMPLWTQVAALLASGEPLIEIG